MYPAMLSVVGRSCLVVGGGGVALRKVDGLLLEDARVTVVAPEPLEALEELAAKGRITLERRPYRAGEAGGHALVFAATDDREVNRRIAADADTAGRWVNVADDPELCTFHLPAQVRRGGLKLVIASGGEAPFVVRRLRQLLEARFGAEWAAWLDAAARFRRRVRSQPLPIEAQERAFDAWFEATVDPAALRARVPTEPEVDRLVDARDEASRPRGETRRGERADRCGLVSLVGAGPGDPGLLTLHGRSRLMTADAVVYDRLAAPALPTDLPPGTALHAVGKEAGHHSVPQEEINALLVRLARDGLRVVRLKGGDPYVFGRGSEEAEALREAGVPFEVIPGVTSGVAVPSYAGIPVTHRREAVRLTFLTAHESAKEGGSQVDWALLARDPHATIVGYMGVTSLPEVIARLVEAGLDPATPAAVIHRGTTSAQRVVRARVKELAAEVVRRDLRPPALFVIGPTARHADHLDWFTARPLFGERLVIAMPAGALGESLRAAGAEVVELPLPVTEAARVVMGALPITGAIFRVAADVDAFDDERHGAGWGPTVVAWCLGSAAAQRARECGWTHVHEVDAEQLAEALTARRGIETAA